MSPDNDAKEALKQGEFKKSAEAAAATASSMAQDAAESAKATLAAKSTEAKDGLAGEMHDTAAALRRAAHEMRDGSPQGSTFSYLADGLADMADSVKDQDVSDVPGIVNNFARNNPMAFLGGAALLGFAATRFAKASEPSRDPVTPARATPAYPAQTAPMGVDYD
ncbi:hypothetical protein ACFQD0_19460 [Sulfitobacter aestuariivivens]|uniref:DUF3618 domain-containing protein n=2 Tax=Sulfitobacter aestuariivivens TaxID=2766981 RepID=A0A927HGF5_9RHOB|nr:hypothetical protein [Sulfitobacter aestuariivivens]MBD3665921.1 hypothetical protein [Sulfitobacter aestuariivivens]